ERAAVRFKLQVSSEAVIFDRAPDDGSAQEGPATGNRQHGLKGEVSVRHIWRSANADQADSGEKARDQEVLSRAFRHGKALLVEGRVRVQASGSKSDRSARECQSWCRLT